MPLGEHEPSRSTWVHSWLFVGFVLLILLALCVVFCGSLFVFLSFFFYLRRVRRYQRGNQKPYIEEEQTTQWPKEKVQKDKQRSTKHTYTKDRVTQTPLKTEGELRCSGMVSSSYHCIFRFFYTLLLITPLISSTFLPCIRRKNRDSGVYYLETYYLMNLDLFQMAHSNRIHLHKEVSAKADINIDLAFKSLIEKLIVKVRF
jgi:hypothetical protein